MANLFFVLFVNFPHYNQQDDSSTQQDTVDRQHNM